MQASKGANLFVSVLTCELFSKKTACRDSATGPDRLSVFGAAFLESMI
jgi:hypothetical protein